MSRLDSGPDDNSRWKVVGLIAGAILGALVGLVTIGRALLRVPPPDVAPHPAPREKEGEAGDRHAGIPITTIPAQEEGPGEEGAAPPPPAEGRATIPAGWNRAAPAHLPPPTYWPAVLALGIVLLFWGLVSSPIISAVGLGLFALGLGGWIGDLRHAT